MLYHISGRSGEAGGGRGGFGRFLLFPFLTLWEGGKVGIYFCLFVLPFFVKLERNRIVPAALRACSLSRLLGREISWSCGYSASLVKFVLEILIVLIVIMVFI